MKYALAPAVKRDLDEIAAWIAQDSPRRALKVVLELRAAFRKIAQNPMLYRVRPDIGQDARLFVAGHHVVLFRIDEETVRFERVVYGGRDLHLLYR